MVKRMVKLSELMPGDVVRVCVSEEYSTATVREIRPDGRVQVARPFIHVGDCLYSGPSCSTYVGLETFFLHGAPVELLSESRISEVMQARAEVHCG